MNRIIKTIEDKSFVSFDIFDTLIRRMVPAPSDVFTLVEKEYNKRYSKEIVNFKFNRIEAENIVRKNTYNDEVTFNEIYDKLMDYYTLDEVEILKKIEIEVETNICKFNSEIFDIYNWCISNNKKIIITSDMYLDRIVIEKILKNNNIEYHKLFLSSDLLKTKHKGNIYEYILNDLNINADDLVHIGDNIKSDYLSPKSYGIKSVHWKNSQKINLSNSLTKCIIDLYLLNHNNKEYDLFSKIGYEDFGPLLLCFSKWLLNELYYNDIKKVFFLARDGYIMKRAFDIVNLDNDIVDKYFYASRRSIIVPSLKDYSNIKDIFSSMHIDENIKVASLLKKVGLDDIVNKYNFKELYDVDINEEIKSSLLFDDNKYSKMFNNLYNDIIENSIKEFDAFIDYKSKNMFQGKIAIIDIGWFGNMQHALEKMNLDVNIYGFYMGIEPRKNYQRVHKMNGFLFDSDNNFNNFLYEHNFNSIFEMLFLGQHGSVKRFNKESKIGVDLYDYEYSNSVSKHNIKLLQDSAIKFVEDFFNDNLFDYLYDDLSCGFDNLRNTFLNPTYNVAETFGNMNFLDNENDYIAKPKKYYEYINLKKLINDYKKSSWRIGFLKRLFRINFPYFSVNMFFRKIYLKLRRKSNGL